LKSWPLWGTDRPEDFKQEYTSKAQTKDFYWPRVMPVAIK